MIGRISLEKKVHKKAQLKFFQRDLIKLLNKVCERKMKKIQRESLERIL
jgi:hypothetical protein